MAPTPLRPHPVDVLTRDLVAVYARGQARLEELVAQGLHRGLDPSRLGTENQRAGDATQAYRARQLAQARVILAELQTQGRIAATLAVGNAYGAGLVAVDRVLGSRPGGTEGLAGRFGRIHVAQVEALAGNLTASLDAAAQRIGSNLDLVFARAGELEGALSPRGHGGLPTQFLGRRVNDPYRQVALEQIAQGTIGLETRRQVSAGLARRLIADGVTDATTAFVDRAGRRWGLDTYAAMATRTTTREAASRATANRMLEGGDDLVTISEHEHAPDECSPFEGNTYSLSGNTPGYDVLDEAPPFHPNCVHVMYPAADNLEAFELELEAAAQGALTAPPSTDAAQAAYDAAAENARAIQRRHGINSPEAKAARDAIPPAPAATPNPYSEPRAPLPNLSAPTRPPAPPFGERNAIRYDTHSADRLDAERIARAIAGDPGHDLDAFEATIKAGVREERAAARALKTAAGPDLGDFIFGGRGRRPKAFAVKEDLRGRLVRGELNIDEARSIVEAYEQERYAAFQERELMRRPKVRPCPCFHCGRFKPRASSICQFCGDDPVSYVDAADATSGRYVENQAGASTYAESNGMREARRQLDIDVYGLDPDDPNLDPNGPAAAPSKAAIAAYSKGARRLRAGRKARGG